MSRTGNELEFPCCFIIRPPLETKYILKINQKILIMDMNAGKYNILFQETTVESGLSHYAKEKRKNVATRER